MVFSSIVFLCAFLPVTLLLDWLIPGVTAKNAVLIVASLLFYAYGEPVLVLLLVASTLFNWAMGMLVDAREGAARKAVLVVSVVVNLGLLAVFKYSAMLVETANALMGLSLPVPAIPLPLGISFYTFQALSYVIDVYRGDAQPQRKYTRVLLYISLFPQLVAGPIVKYHDIELEMGKRHATTNDVAVGLRRFCMGLAKKVLIANTMAPVVDDLLALHAGSLTAPGAWLVAFAYLMQIYFDFSGYSDMAIGLGRVLGFHFRENFDHPYASASVKEFWRRWHISLSTWLRDYLYIPLGGNRKGARRAVVNRIIVFLLCGLWHGASWTFVVWGLLHGLALLLESAVPVHKLPKMVGHLYTTLFVMLAFVVFRCDTLMQSGEVIRAMFCDWRMDATSLAPVMEHLTPFFLAVALGAVLLCGSLPGRMAKTMESRLSARGTRVTQICSYVCAIALLVLCMASLAGGTYNPFIYFRF